MTICSTCCSSRGSGPPRPRRSQRFGELRMRARQSRKARQHQRGRLTGPAQRQQIMRSGSRSAIGSTAMVANHAASQ